MSVYTFRISIFYVPLRGFYLPFLNRMLAIAFYNRRVQPSEKLGLLCLMYLLYGIMFTDRRLPITPNNILISSDAAYISKPNDVIARFSPFFQLSGFFIDK